jgi:hypothetical protein
MRVTSALDTDGTEADHTFPVTHNQRQALQVLRETIKEEGSTSVTTSASSPPMEKLSPPRSAVYGGDTSVGGLGSADGVTGVWDPSATSW